MSRMDVRNLKLHACNGSPQVHYHTEQNKLGNSEYWAILKTSLLLQLYKQLHSSIAHTGSFNR